MTFSKHTKLKSTLQNRNEKHFFFIFTMLVMAVVSFLQVPDSAADLFRENDGDIARGGSPNNLTDAVFVSADCSFNDASPYQIWSTHSFSITNDWDVKLHYNYGWHLEIVGYAHNGGIYTDGGSGTLSPNSSTSLSTANCPYIFLDDVFDLTEDEWHDVDLYTSVGATHSKKGWLQDDWEAWLQPQFYYDPEE